MESTHIGVEYLVYQLALQPSLIWKICALTAVLYLIHELFSTVYDVYYGPLSMIPGPRLWAASRLPMAWIIWTGRDAMAKTALHKKYGSVVRLSPKDVSFDSGRAWKDIYGHRVGHKESFHKDPQLYARHVNGEWGIISTPSNEDHARQRRILSHSFSSRSLKEQEPLLKSWAHSLVEKLRERQGKPTDAVAYFNFTAFDIMADLTFAEPLHMLEGSEYVPWVKVIFESVTVATRLSVLRKLPTLQWIPRLLGNLIRKKQVENFNYAAARVDKRLANKPDKPNLWTEVLKRGGEDGRMSLAEMHANSLSFMVAGTETTATWLSGLTYLLLRNPDALEKVVREIRTTFSSEDDMTLEALGVLPYLHACMEEALRVYPPVPTGLPRKAPKGGAFVDGVLVPDDVSVAVTQLAAYRSEANWYKPYDYIPERWLKQDEKFAKDDHTSFQPFSMGPRNCIGRNLAYHEARVLICLILWNFDLELMEESAHWIDQRLFTFWKKGPLLVKFKAVVR